MKCAHPDPSAFTIRLFGHGRRLALDAIILVGPLAEVDQLTTLRTERPGRVIFPHRRPAAGWAFNLFSHLSKGPLATLYNASYHSQNIG